MMKCVMVNLDFNFVDEWPIRILIGQNDSWSQFLSVGFVYYEPMGTKCKEKALQLYLAPLQLSSATVSLSRSAA